MRALLILLPVAALGVSLQGCCAPRSASLAERTASQADALVDFNDPVLNRRQILLFGKLDGRAAEQIIQKLLYLDGKSQDPIDLYIQSPGDEKQDSLVIEQALEYGIVDEVIDR
jgi:ATP-dependent protease ClpP protease subunit